MNLDLFDLLKANSLFEHLPESLRELWNNIMAAPKVAMGTGVMTAEEVEQVIMEVEVLESVGIVVEIPKSPHTPRPKNDKQAMVLVHVSPRNPLRTRLTMEETRKVINLEADDEEEFEEILVEEEDVEMEVHTQGVDPLTRLPTYVPPQKGKVKVPKGIDERKSSLQTPLLPDDIIFKGVHSGQVPVLKFQDWDLVDHEKFPHLATA